MISKTQEDLQHEIDYLAYRLAGILNCVVTTTDITIAMFNRFLGARMKPTVDNILAKYNIRPYNGSWYVTEKSCEK